MNGKRKQNTEDFLLNYTGRACPFWSHCVARSVNLRESGELNEGARENRENNGAGNGAFGPAHNNNARRAAQKNAERFHCDLSERTAHRIARRGEPAIPVLLEEIWRQLSPAHSMIRIFLIGYPLTILAVCVMAYVKGVV